MRRAIPYLAVLCLCVAAMGCQKLFTTSLGTKFVRPAASIPDTISAAAASQVLASTDDPAVLTNLLDALNTQAATGSAEVQALAAEAALGASDVSTEITNLLLDSLGSGTPPSGEDISALVTDLIAGAGVGLDVGAHSGVVSALLLLGNEATLVAADMSSTELVVSALILAADALNEVSPGTTDLSALTAEEQAAIGEDIAATQQGTVALALLSAAQDDVTSPELKAQLDALALMLGITL